MKAFTSFLNGNIMHFIYILQSNRKIFQSYQKLNLQFNATLNKSAWGECSHTEYMFSLAPRLWGSKHSFPGPKLYSHTHHFHLLYSFTQNILLPHFSPWVNLFCFISPYLGSYAHNLILLESVLLICWV